MLVTPRSIPRIHRIWFVLAILVTSGSGVGYGWEWYSGRHLPGGGSWTGLTFGVMATAICFFEAALVLRRTSWLRTRRRLLGIPLGSARTWMAAHIWLGVISAPLVAMHSGLRWGGPLTSWLAIVFYVVIASGVVGLVLQNVLPRLMTEQVPEETIFSQIDVVGRQLAGDAVRLARLYGGSGPDGYWARWDAEFGAHEVRSREAVMTIGAPRRVGTFIARAPQPSDDVVVAGESPELRRAVRDEVAEFLLTGRSETGRFTSPQRIAWYFDDLRRRVRPEAATAVEQIESLCQRRRQFGLQARLHFWLHSWLVLHLPLSMALLILLVAHILAALAYG